MRENTCIFTRNHIFFNILALEIYLMFERANILLKKVCYKKWFNINYANIVHYFSCEIIKENFI